MQWAWGHRPSHQWHQYQTQRDKNVLMSHENIVNRGIHFFEGSPQIMHISNLKLQEDLYTTAHRPFAIFRSIVCLRNDKLNT